MNMIHTLDSSREQRTPAEQLDRLRVTRCDSYVSNYTGRPEDQLTYPGERPESSYMNDGEHVMPIVVGDAKDLDSYLMKLPDGSIIKVNEYLAAHNVPGLADRIPVVSFAANVCPPSMSRKFAIGEGYEDMLIIPTIYGTIAGMDVVWNHRPGQKGNHIAQAYAGPETRDTQVQVGISFLTPEQLAWLDYTEGQYQRAACGQVTMEDGTAIPAIMYVGEDEVAVGEDGRPIAIAGIMAEGRTLPERNGTDMLEQTLAIPGVREAVAAYDPSISTEKPIDYATAAMDKDRKLKDRKDLQAAVDTAIRGQGRYKRTSTLEDPKVDIYPMTHPEIMPSLGVLLRQPERISHHGNDTIYVIPEELIVRGVNRAKLLKKQRDRWHKEYEQRTADAAAEETWHQKVKQGISGK